MTMVTALVNAAFAAQQPLLHPDAPPPQTLRLSPYLVRQVVHLFNYHSVPANPAHSQIR